MSRSSGQVTHVLLTRSRLCPGPKPGSSLHLHVLGTPPAFVLSQDQTLRGELLNFTKESSGVQPADLTARHVVTPPAAGKPLGLSAGGIRPSRPSAPTGQWPEVWSSRTPRAPDARRGQSWHRRLSRSAKRTKATAASNLDTLLGRGIGREVRMLLSFQRPSHLFKKGVPS